MSVSIRISWWCRSVNWRRPMLIIAPNFCSVIGFYDAVDTVTWAPPFSPPIQPYHSARKAEKTNLHEKHFKLLNGHPSLGNF